MNTQTATEVEPKASDLHHEADHELSVGDYFLVWLGLMGIFAVSVIASAMGHSILAIFMIFELAVVKAWLVVSYYMHLKFEPKIVTGIFLFSILCLFFLFFGVYPDIMPVKLELAR